MKTVLALGLWTLSLTVAVAGCGVPHYHGYYEADYYHRHELTCGCAVRCHVHRGAHYYEHHDHRGAYWHRPLHRPRILRPLPRGPWGA